MLVLLAVHAGTAAALPWCARRLGRTVWSVAALIPLAAVVWSVTQAAPVLDGRPVTESLAWAPSLGLTLDLRLDALSLLMLWIVGGVGALVLLYCRYYVERDSGRESALLVAFAGAMTGLILADNLFCLYLFWELTTVVSFLLIAGRGETEERRRAADQALLVTVGGGLAMLLGFVMLGEAADTYRISEILADPPRGGTVSAAVVLVLVGAFAKSAQMPLHGWLPAAMVAPAPVSAYLHAAAMVKAGVYLVARLAPGFAEVAPWRPMVLCVGLVTLVLGAWQALRETDLKRLLAYGTVSMLGMLTALLGAGTRTAALAGMTMLVAHALYKSALFLAAGIIDRQAGSRDLRELTGLARSLPGVLAVAALAVASLAGLPPLAGFLGKEAGLEAFLHDTGLGPHAPLVGALVLGGLLTVAYGSRFLWGAFGPRAGAAGGVPPASAAGTGVMRPAAGFLAPVAVLAAAGAVLGIWYAGTSVPVTAYADVYPAGAGKPYKLSLWHGFTPVLGLSVLSIALGLLLPAGRPGAGGGGLGAAPSRLHSRLSRLLSRLRPPRPRLPDPQRSFRRTLDAVDVLAVRLTRRTQVGSLPVYLTVVLAFLVAVPGAALLAAAPPIDRPPLWRSVLEVPLVLVVLAATVAVTTTTHRLTGVLLVSAVGYAVAGIFLLYGAPDLALTQFLVETMTLVLVVLVLRRMPPRFTPGRTAPRVQLLRGGVAAAAGVFVAAFALAASSAREDAGVSEGYLRRMAETGAYNVVNAIIVDFRALDTLGEISVLMVTAIGMVSVVRVWSRSGPAAQTAAGAPHGSGGGGNGADRNRRAAPSWDEPRESWLPGAHERPGGERSVLLEVVTRLVFPSIVLLSLYLLFSGHYRPGGGFAGGLVAGQALVLRYLVGGRADFGLAAPVGPGVVAGGGLALAAGYGLLPAAFGGAPLAATVLTADLPVLGTVKFATSLFFDVGIYLLVVGVTLKLLSAVGISVTDHASPAPGEPAPANGRNGRDSRNGGDR